MGGEEGGMEEGGGGGGKVGGRGGRDGRSEGGEREAYAIKLHSLVLIAQLFS